MIFAHPWAAAAAGTVLLFLFVLMVLDFRRKENLYHLLGDPKVLKRLVEASAPRHQRLKSFFFLLGGFWLAVALAGPRWGLRFEEVRRRGVDVLIAVDVSASMLAEDVKPNRLVQAKRELRRLIDGLEGDRVGILAFAGQAFLQCPLTLDYDAARSILDLVDPSLIPQQGTNLASALEAACDSFVKDDRGHKALVLLTDGEDHSGRLPSAVKRAEDEGVRVFAVGFGSPQGEIIPLRSADGGLKEYKKDKEGKTVLSKLNETDLAGMAVRTGARYYRATGGEVEVEHILRDIRGMDKKSLESRRYDRTEDRSGIFILLAFLFFLLEFLWPETPGYWGALFRSFRRSPALLIPLFFLPCSAASQGRVPGTGPSRAVLRARAAAEKSPDDPKARYNLGNALYRDGDHAAALEAYDQAEASFRPPDLRARASYNAGNALFRQGKLSEAVEKYKQALRSNPGDVDAKHNLELAQKILKSKPAAPKGGEDEKKQDGGGEDSPPKPPSSAPKPGEMTKEDAERLLQAVAQQEKEAREKMKSDRPTSVPAGEDW